MEAAGGREEAAELAGQGGAVAFGLLLSVVTGDVLLLLLLGSRGKVA